MILSTWAFLVVLSVPMPPAGPPRAISPQEGLQDDALRFARAWVNGDPAGLRARLVGNGIRLHLQNELHPSVGVERALSAIQAFLARFSGGEAELMRASRSASSEPLGFAEFRWRTRVAGSGEDVTFTLFLALSQAGDGWVVTEIRVLP